MRTLSRATLIVIAMLSLGLTWDYRQVRAKDIRVARAVVSCGGRMNSLPCWPLGTEYHVSFRHPLSEPELQRLTELNTLRGSVAVAFVDCELTVEQASQAKRYLSDCHVFRVSQNRIIPWNPAEVDAPDPATK